MRGDIYNVIAIGASTGGVDAVEQILSRFTEKTPPVLLVIHMQKGFTALYAANLNRRLKISVREAVQGDCLVHGKVFIAPAGKHMEIVQRENKLSVDCYTGEKINHVIPSADVLFESVAKVLRGNAIGVLLTGIGTDGARGLLSMKQNGAVTIGQDRASSAVYGMPKVAKELGSLVYELPLSKIADKILSLV